MLELSCTRRFSLNKQCYFNKSICTLLYSLCHTDCEKEIIQVDCEKEIIQVRKKKKKSYKTILFYFQMATDHWKIFSRYHKKILSHWLWITDGKITLILLMYNKILIFYCRAAHNSGMAPFGGSWYPSNVFCYLLSEKRGGEGGESLKNILCLKIH